MFYSSNNNKLFAADSWFFVMLAKLHLFYGIVIIDNSVFIPKTS